MPEATDSVKMTAPVSKLQTKHHSRSLKSDEHSVSENLCDGICDMIFIAEEN